jgi:hypothetical protein
VTRDERTTAGLSPGDLIGDGVGPPTRQVERILADEEIQHDGRYYRHSTAERCAMWATPVQNVARQARARKRLDRLATRGRGWEE